MRRAVFVGQKVRFKEDFEGTKKGTRGCVRHLDRQLVIGVRKNASTCDSIIRIDFDRAFKVLDFEFSAVKTAKSSSG